MKLAPWLIASTIAWSVGVVFNIYYQGEISSLRLMYQQKLLLASQTKDSTKLLVIGGSGAHNSLNSQLIQQELGINVLNFGLDGQLGLNVLLAVALETINSGDIVLLIPEDVILLDEDGLSYRSLPFSASLGKPQLAYASPKQFFQDIWFLGVPSLRPLTRSTLDLLREGQIIGYYSYSLTTNGDPTVIRTGKIGKRRVPQTLSDNSIVQIMRFQQKVEEKDATLIISLPWFSAQADQLSIRNVKDIAAKLSMITDTIYDPNTMNLQTDESFFADTEHHLNSEGKLIRSQQLIKQLRPFLN